ncbi:hypothetical protein P349_04926 [Enterobacter sp. DC4]|uniref:hypothetical protein n=1 Tax=Enterobacter sp. DC4 TaxID=1395580 RepID=UPI0003ED0CE4|nr:hypothetical protein [Enterobacter sp. DC4]EWG65499.1 hypothetical protein P349_04926 [Enterobacter sp. DC4]
MSSWKDVTGFSAVKVTRYDGTQTGKIYANGLNQTEIVVYFEPIDVNGRLVTGLTSDDYLEPMALIDAETGTELDWHEWNESSNWTYTEYKHEYYYPVPDNKTVADITEGGYSFTFYVSCSADATFKSMGIAVQFALADGSTYSTGDNSQNASKTTIHTRKKIIYDTENTKVTKDIVVNEDLIDKNIPETDHGTYLWGQINYGLYPNDDDGAANYFISSELFNYALGDFSMKYCFYEKIHGWGNDRLAYFWPMDLKSPRIVGRGNFSLTINTMKGAFNFTKVYYHHHDWEDYEWTDHANDNLAILTDQYGNSGRFHFVKFDNDSADITVASAN